MQSLPNTVPVRLAPRRLPRLVLVLLAMLAFCLALSRQGANPQVPQGGSANFPSTGTEAPTTGTWDILNPSGTQIANSNAPAGWSVSLAGTTFTVGAPSSATIAANYKVRYGGMVISPDLTAKGKLVKGPKPAKAVPFAVLRLLVPAPFPKAQGQGPTPMPSSASALFDVSGGVSPPPAPTGLSAFGRTTRVDLTWMASAGATGYTVKWGTAAGGPYTLGSQAATASPATVAGLTNGTKYYFVVVASNAGGASGNSNEANATPIAIPAGVTATPGNAQVSLSWSAAIGATGYKVLYGTTPGTYPNSVTSAGTSATVTGLANGTTYYFVVTGTNTVGESDRSGQVSTVPTGGTPPAAPTGVTPFGRTSRVDVNWTASAGATGYTVKWGTVAGGPYTLGSQGATASPSTVGGLTNGTRYYFVVSASNGAGSSPNSAEGSGTPIAVPPSVVATPGNAQASLTWGAAAGATAYNVKWGTTSGGPYNNVVSVPGTSATVTGLANGTTYYFVVRGTNTVGESDFVSQVSATPAAPPTPPAAPTGVTAVGGTSKATVTWSASAGATSHTITWGAAPGGPYTLGSQTVPSPAVIGGLTNGTKYYFVVTASNAAGASPNSVEANATPIAVPVGVTATPGNGQVALSWGAAAGATGYKVKYGTTSGGPYTLGPVTATGTSATVTGLTNGTTYYFVVTGTNTVGESDPSSQVSGLPQGPPPVPTNLAAVAGTSKVTLTWTASAGAASYTLKRGAAPGGPYPTLIPNLTGTQFVDTVGLANGTKVYYVLTATANGQESVPSNEASATPIAVPTGVTATPGSGQVALSWSAAAGATGYTVKWGTASGGPYTVGSTTSATASATATGLTGGTTYYFVVTGTNTVGESDPSAQASAAPTGTGSGNPKVPQGGSSAFPPTGTLAPSFGPGWQILNPSGTDVGNSQPNNAQGWSVTYDVPTAKLTVGAPPTATIATGYTVKYFNTSQGSPKSALFDVVPNVPALFEYLRPAWMEANIPWDRVESEGNGPSSADSTDLATGTQSHGPPADIVAVNPTGPGAAYRRTYRSTRALAGHSSPGLPTGWYDNYGYSVQSANPTAWSNLTLKYPNGAVETFTPILNAGSPTGAFTRPSGAPYVLIGVPGGTPGTWTSLTLKFRDLSRWIFVSTGAGQYRLTQIANAGSGFISLNRDGAGKLNTIVNSEGATLLSFAYDAGGLVQTITDAYVRQVRYAYTTAAGAPNLLSVSQIVPTGTTTPPLKWQYGYVAIQGKPFLNSVAGLDASNPGVLVSHPIAYDTVGGRATGMSDANGNVRTYTYRTGETDVQIKTGASTALAFTQIHANGLFAGLRDARGKTTTVGFGDPLNPGSPTSTTNRNGQTVSMTYDAFGNLKTLTDSRAVITTYGYDYAIWPTGLVTSIQTAGKTATNFEYYPSGYLYRELTPRPGTSNTGEQVISKQYAYTALGNVASVRTLNFAGTQVVSSYSYTVDGPYTTSEKVGQPVALTDPMGYVTHYRYDASGRLTQQSDPVGNTTNYEYNDANQVTRIIHPATGQTGSLRGYTAYAYDGYGGTLKQRREYNESGGIAFEENYAHGKEADGKGSSGTVETAATLRDGVYRTSGVTNGNSQTTSVGFDAVGNPRTRTYPLGDGSSIQVDDEGETTQRTDGRGRVTNYVLAPDDSRPTNVNYVADPSRSAAFGYDGFSRLTSVTDHTGTVTYAYDDLDNVTSVATQFTGLPGTFTVSHVYNPDGSRASMTTPFSTYSYNYDNNGRLTRVGPTLPGGQASYTYYANGWLATQSNPRFDTEFVYNGRGFLTRMTTYSGISPYPIRSQFRNMTYDALGNLRTALIDVPAVGFAADASGSLEILYDAKFRPTREARWLSNGTVLYDHSYGIDNAGNPTSALGATQPVNANSQIATTGFQYDGQGNPTTYKGVTLGWDNEDRSLSVAGVLTQEFRVTGERTWKTTPSGKRTYYLYDGDQVICEIAGANSSVAAGGVYGAYVYGAWGLNSRWSGVAQEYHTLSWDPFGNLVQRHRQFEDGTSTLPAGTSTYSSRGVLIADAAKNFQGSLPIVDPVGPLSQQGELTDEELKISGSARGLQLLSGGGFFDPAAGRYVNRVGGDDNEYRYAWKALGLMGLAGQRAATQAQADIANSLDDVQLALDGIGMIPGFGEPVDLINGGISYARGDKVGAAMSLGAAIPGAGNVVGAAKIARNVGKRFAKVHDIVKYGEQLAGGLMHKHHGVMDKWAAANIGGYVSRHGDAPTIVLRAKDHTRTFGVFNTWKAGMKKSMGGTFNWSKVSPRDIFELSERMFDVAGVPQSARNEYYREFNRYIYGLK